MGRRDALARRLLVEALLNMFSFSRRLGSWTPINGRFLVALRWRTLCLSILRPNKGSKADAVRQLCGNVGTCLGFFRFFSAKLSPILICHCRPIDPQFLAFHHYHIYDSYYYVRDSNKDRNGNGIQSNELNNSYVERSHSANTLKEIMVGFAKPALTRIGLAPNPEKECRGQTMTPPPSLTWPCPYGPFMTTARW